MQETSDQVHTPALLFIDEWFLLKPLEAEPHDIFELLHCWRKKPSTVFYSQCGLSDGAEAILDSIKHDSNKIHIIPSHPANYRSMRKMYGLDTPINK